MESPLVISAHIIGKVPQHSKQIFWKYNNHLIVAWGKQTKQSMHGNPAMTAEWFAVCQPLWGCSIWVCGRAKQGLQSVVHSSKSSTTQSVLDTVVAGTPS